MLSCMVPLPDVELPPPLPPSPKKLPLLLPENAYAPAAMRLMAMIAPTMPPMSDFLDMLI